MFIHPEALWLLAAAPLPVLLHLIGTARPRDLLFPGVYLLRQMAARRRAFRLRHLLLLVLRTAAIAAAAIICAGPQSARPLPVLSSVGTPTVALDASASMGSRDAAAWQQAVEVLHLLEAKGQRPRLILSPAPSDNSAHPTTPAQPSRSQGALADAVLAAERQGLLSDDGPLYVVTDLDASTILPRRWPPGTVPVAATIVACASPEPGIYAIRHRPCQPVAGLPVTLSCYMRPAGRETIVGVSERGASVATARTTPSTRCAVLPLSKLASGQHEIEISVRPTQTRTGQAGAAAGPVVAQTAWKYFLRVSEAAGVAVAASGQAARFLGAAVNPQGTGRPFFVTGLPQSCLVIADGSAVPLASSSLSACGGLVLFAGPTTGQWLKALGLRGDVKPPGAALAADQAEGLRIAADAPPAWRGVMELFRPTLESAQVFRRARLELASDWWVLARFSDGAPAIAWSEAGQRPVLVIGFSPTPDATDLVASGAFAALLHAFLAEMLPPQAQPTQRLTHQQSADNPPPAERAGALAAADQIRAAWGSRTQVVYFSPTMQLPPQRRPADLVPLMVLMGLAVLGAEWLLSRRLSAG